MADSEEYTGLVPDSDLDRALGIDEIFYWCENLRGGQWVGVKPNDWLDVDLSNLNDKIDPLWGSSFQVVQCFEKSLTIKMLQHELLEYIEVEITPEYILNNFIRAETFDEEPT